MNILGDQAKEAEQNRKGERKKSNYDRIRSVNENGNEIK